MITPDDKRSAELLPPWLAGMIGITMAGVWLLAWLPHLSLPSSAMWLLRLIVILALAGLVIPSVRRGSVGLLSPPLLLGGVVTVLFVLLPALYSILAGSEIRHHRPVVLLLYYVGGEAELHMLSFSGLLLMAAAASLARGREILEWRDFQESRARQWLVTLSGAISALAVWRISALYAGAEGRLPEGLAIQYLFDSLQPLLSIAIVTAAYMASGAKLKAHLILALVVTLALATAALLSAVKMVLASLAAAALLYWIRRRLALKIIVPLVVIGTTVIALLIAGVNLKRQDLLDDALSGVAIRNMDHYVTDQLISKVIHRQGWTGFCLATVLDQHLDNRDLASPLYFLAGLVPRAVWREKPALSLGSYYTTEYCGTMTIEFDPLRPHSAAITLLGEPVIVGGRKTLMMAEIFLAAILGLLSIALLGGGTITTIWIVALLPWLVDFEQSLSFYIANAVKSALYTLPWVALFSRLLKQESRTPVPES